MQQESQLFCAKCSLPLLRQWKGWPHGRRGVIPLLPALIGRACPTCAGSEALRSEDIAWLNYHGEFNAGLPDYWLLIIAGSSNDWVPDDSQAGMAVPNKWGIPYYARGSCWRCGAETVVSEHIVGNAKFRHNCQKCGVLRMKGGA